jgi:hypothetical protein
MADQVHRRERLKRRQAFVWRATWRARLASPGAARAALPRLPPAPPHRLQVRALPHPGPGSPAAPATLPRLLPCAAAGPRRLALRRARHVLLLDTADVPRHIPRYACFGVSQQLPRLRAKARLARRSKPAPAVSALTPRARTAQQAAGADVAPTQQLHAQAAAASASVGTAPALAQHPSCAAAAASAGAAAAAGAPGPGRPCHSPARVPKPERAGARASRAAAPSPAQHSCHWCGGGGGAAMDCTACGRRFCFRCYQRRAGYGVQGWARAAREPAYRCPVCTGAEPAAPGTPDERARACSAGLCTVVDMRCTGGRCRTQAWTGLHAGRAQNDCLACRTAVLASRQDA